MEALYARVCEPDWTINQDCVCSLLTEVLTRGLERHWCANHFIGLGCTACTLTCEAMDEIGNMPPEEIDRGIRRFKQVTSIQA